MKRIITIVIAILILSSFSISIAENDFNPTSIPNYDEMISQRVVLGIDTFGDEVYEFPGMNIRGLKFEDINIMTDDELINELYKKDICFTALYVTMVDDFDIYALTLEDESIYAISLAISPEGNYFVNKDSFDIFVKMYFGDANIPNKIITSLQSTDENYITFKGLNPVLDIGGCPGLLSPKQAYLNLYNREVPIEDYKVMHVNGRNMMVLFLDDSSQYALDCLETFGENGCFVLEETLYNFCTYYFGDDYDFFKNDPPHELWV